MRLKLKYGGNTRKKALFGVDGAINATATLAAAAITAAATKDAAAKQADAVVKNAETQAASIKAQTDNNTELQKQSLAFTRQQNKEQQEIQRGIQTAIQMNNAQANQQTTNNANKVVAKYGTRKISPKTTRKIERLSPKQRKLLQKSINAYNKEYYDDVDYELLANVGLTDDWDGEYRMEAARGARHSLYGRVPRPFKVTDGGEAIPRATDDNGYGLYELQGNDHEHYHKAAGGHYKSGVGVKFPDGTTIEGEGNQNSDQGELLYVTPDDALFLSKHNIAGFNPTAAVEAGMHPKTAFAIQEAQKDAHGYSDDGSKQPARSNGHRRLKCGGRAKADLGQFWNNYGDAAVSTGGTLGAGIIGTIAAKRAGNRLNQAYGQAGQILANAYDQMKGIDESSISRNDYAPTHAIAVVREANTNINPQLERLRRNAASERKLTNQSTMSSAARQQRLSGINDRMMQRMNEQYAAKEQADEAIKQQNAERISDTSLANAKLNAAAAQQYQNARLTLAQYNNQLENAKIAGKAQALASASVQQAGIDANTANSIGNTWAGAISNIGNTAASSIQSVQDRNFQLNSIIMGQDPDKQLNSLLNANNPTVAKSYYNNWKNSSDPKMQEQAKRLNDVYHFEQIPISAIGQGAEQIKLQNIDPVNVPLTNTMPLSSIASLDRATNRRIENNNFDSLPYTPPTAASDMKEPIGLRALTSPYELNKNRIYYDNAFKTLELTRNFSESTQQKQSDILNDRLYSKIDPRLKASTIDFAATPNAKPLDYQAPTLDLSMSPYQQKKKDIEVENLVKGLRTEQELSNAAQLTTNVMLDPQGHSRIKLKSPYQDFKTLMDNKRWADSSFLTAFLNRGRIK